MARFWPKWRYNGRVMAREVSFYQCLWVTKLCAKFGCSRTPRTASAHKSFIVLRCMWKEPAPLLENLAIKVQKGEKLRDWSLESNYGKITGRVKEAMSWMKLKAATNWSTKSAGLRLIEIYPRQRQKERDFNKSWVFHSILRFSHLWQHQTSFLQWWYIL